MSWVVMLQRSVLLLDDALPPCRHYTVVACKEARQVVHQIHAATAMGKQPAIEELPPKSSVEALSYFRSVILIEIPRGSLQLLEMVPTSINPSGLTAWRIPYL